MDFAVARQAVVVLLKPYCLTGYLTDEYSPALTALAAESEGVMTMYFVHHVIEDQVGRTVMFVLGGPLLLEI